MHCRAILGLNLLLALLGWVVPGQSWRRALWVQFPAIVSVGLLLPLVGWFLVSPSGGPCWCSSLPFFPRPTAVFNAVAGPSPFLAEGPLGAVPCHSWLTSAAGFGAVDGPSPMLSEGSVGAVSCHFWLERWFWLWCGGWFFCQSWRRVLSVQVTAILGWGVLLTSGRWVVPRRSPWRALWVQCPATTGLGLQVAVVGWWITRLSRCSVLWLWFPASPVAVFGGGWLVAFPGEALVGVVPCLSLLWAAGGRGGWGVSLCPSLWWAVLVFFPAFAGRGPGPGWPLALRGGCSSPLFLLSDLLLAVVSGAGPPLHIGFYGVQKSQNQL